MSMVLERRLVPRRQFALVAVRRTGRRVDAALGLVPPAPAARARVFAGGDGAGARLAADREVALRLERVARQIVLGEVGVEIVLGPVAKRVDLEPAVLDLEARQVLAGERLERFAAADPGIEALLGALERFNLANLAAAVRVPRPAQAGLVLGSEHREVGLD